MSPLCFEVDGVDQHQLGVTVQHIRAKQVLYRTIRLLLHPGINQPDHHRRLPKVGPHQAGLEVLLDSPTVLRPHFDPSLD